MDNLNDIIRDKILKARPPLKASNWAEMESLLDKSMGKSGSSWMGKKWIWLGIWLIFSLIIGSSWYLAAPEKRADVEETFIRAKSGSISGISQLPDSAQQLTFGDHQLSNVVNPDENQETLSEKNALLHTDDKSLSKIWMKESETGNMSRVEMSSLTTADLLNNTTFYKEDATVRTRSLAQPLVLPSQILSAIPFPLDSRQPDKTGLHLPRESKNFGDGIRNLRSDTSLAATYVAGIEYLLKKQVYNRRKRMATKKFPFRRNYISFFINTMNVPAHKVSGTSVIVPDNPYPGVGISVIRRIDEKTDFGLRIDLEEIWFRPWFGHIENSFMDVWGINREYRLFFRRHFRPHVIYRFRPYWTISSGFTYWKLNATHGRIKEFPDINLDPHAIENMKFFRLPGKQIESYSKEFVYTEVNFLGPVERQFNWSGSAGIGIEIRLFRALFFNWETSIHYNIPINHFTWDVDLESILNGERIRTFGYPTYSRTSLGFSFGF